MKLIVINVILCTLVSWWIWDACPFKGNTAVSRKVVLQTGKSLRDNVESYYEQWWFLQLLEWTLGCFSVVEGNNTNTGIHAFSFLVAESPRNSIKQSQTITTHNTNRHCRVRFYTFVVQLLSKQLIRVLNRHKRKWQKFNSFIHIETSWKQVLKRKAT